MGALAADEILLFEDCRLDRRGLFRRDERGVFVPVPIGSRALYVLRVLIAAEGELVSKDEIMAAVWPGTVVEDNNLTVQISTLRRILDQGRADGSCIQTVAGRGYRFLAPVTRVEPVSPPISSPISDPRGGEGEAENGAVAPLAAALPTLDKPSIAVLPFANLSGDPEQEYFADGMVEEIITALSRIRWVFVLARNLSFTWKGEAIDVKRVGRELGVRYVLEGSVRRGGNRVRISAQLIEAETGEHLWADRFDGSLEDVFDLQDKVASSVAGVIEPALRAAEAARSASRRTSDLTAYDLYLRAGAMCSTYRLRQALALLEEAIARDPRYGPALGLAAQCCQHLATNFNAPDRDAIRPKGIGFGRRAIEVAGDDPGVLANAAMALAVLGEDLDAMIALADRALALNPSYASGWHISGFLRLWAGQTDLAIEHGEMALRLSPRARANEEAFLIGTALFFGRHFEEAVPRLWVAIEAAPAFPNPYRYLAACYAHMGLLDEARAMIARLRAIMPEVVVDLPLPYRDPQHRELFLSGLRLAMGEHSPEPQPSSISSAEPALSEPSAIPTRPGLGAWVHRRAALAVLALVCAIVAITPVIVQWGRPGAPDSGGGTAIAVMPFRNQGDRAVQAKIGEAVAERIAVELARQPATRVVPQKTAAAYTDRPMDSRRLNRDLHAGYAVDGSVTAAGGGIRVEAALVDTGADAVRWSDHFDFADREATQLADEIVTLIIRPLVRSLEQEEANRAAAKEPAEQTADDLLWRGAAAFDRPLSQANRGEARELFEKALMLNPRNVLALSRLALVDITDVMNYPGPEDEAKLSRAEQLLNAASSIGRNNTTRYARCMLLRLQGRFEEAISVCGDVIGDLLYRVFVYKEIGLDYLFLGQLEQAALAFEAADRLSRGDAGNSRLVRNGSVPHLLHGHNWQWLRGGSVSYLLAGRYEEAIDWLRQASDTVPGLVVDGAGVLLAAAYALSGRQQEAVDTLAELRDRSPEILTNADKLSAAIYLRPGTALAPRLQPVIEALRSAGLSEPMVAALLNRANGSSGESRASISAPADVTLGSSVKGMTAGRH
jgi:TolB-like protein